MRTAATASRHSDSARRPPDAGSTERAGHHGLVHVPALNARLRRHAPSLRDHLRSCQYFRSILSRLPRRTPWPVRRRPDDGAGRRRRACHQLQGLRVLSARLVTAVAAGVPAGRRAMAVVSLSVTQTTVEDRMCTLPGKPLRGSHPDVLEDSYRLRALLPATGATAHRPRPSF
jgi:hypothetical protein